MADGSMSTGTAQKAPIIIKKKKVSGGDGHHGGAWKVAYADFVTAMMAFFLLMWLLNATTEDQRKGLADYFDPSVPISRNSSGGDGMFGGESVFADDTLPQMGRGGLGSDDPGQHVSEGSPDEEGRGPKDGEAVNEAGERRNDENKYTAAGAEQLEGAAGLAQETADLETLKGKILEAVQMQQMRQDLMRHLWMEITNAGLTIEIVDAEGDPLFGTGSAEPSDRMVVLLQLVGSAVKLVENRVEIAGHTDARPFGPGARYTNWELSADRAQAARRVFEKMGIPSTRFVSVAGRADSDPALEDRFAAQNRRIEITLMRE